MKPGRLQKKYRKNKLVFVRKIRKLDWIKMRGVA